MPGKKPHKKNKIIALLREGETSSVIIANKVRTSAAYVSVVKNELLRSQGDQAVEGPKNLIIF